MRNMIYAFLENHPVVAWILILFCPITATLYWIFVASEFVRGIIDGVKIAKKFEQITKGVG
jgi:hypothetical protein